MWWTLGSSFPLVQFPRNVAMRGFCLIWLIWMHSKNLIDGFTTGIVKSGIPTELTNAPVKWCGPASFCWFWSRYWHDEAPILYRFLILLNWTPISWLSIKRLNIDTSVFAWRRVCHNEAPGNGHSLFPLSGLSYIYGDNMFSVLHKIQCLEVMFQKKSNSECCNAAWGSCYRQMAFLVLLSHLTTPLITAHCPIMIIHGGQIRGDHLVGWILLDIVDHKW